MNDLEWAEVLNDRVLVEVDIRPEKTKGGIILTDTARDEDQYQSKSGVILKMGPEAFSHGGSGAWFRGLTFKPGDRVVFRPSDGYSMKINGKICRLLTDTAVMMRIDNAERIW